MDPSQNPRGRSSPFDFDRLIGDNSEVRRAADGAEILASVGELVRRVRTARGMTQSELARRTGLTQAHISELERGLGTNGPTVVTLTRIVSELGDTALIDTAKERAAHEARQIEETKSWAAAVVHEAIQKSVAGGASGATRVWAALANATKSDEVKTNPFKRIFGQGIIFGIRMGRHFEKTTGRERARKIAAAMDKEVISLMTKTSSEWETMHSEQEEDMSSQSENR